MKQTPSTKNTVRTIKQHPEHNFVQRKSTGSEGVAIAPPAYGIDVVDSQPVQAGSEPGQESRSLESPTWPMRNRPVQKKSALLSAGSDSPREQPENKTGLPDNLKAGIESLSGIAMDDVNVHYNSAKPAQLQALAYTQGSDIHLGPGQERHLPHEAWHVVQQKQGRVKPTIQAKGVAINDDVGLEHEADVAGQEAMQMRRTDQATPRSAVQAVDGDRNERQRSEIGVIQPKIYKGQKLSWDNIVPPKVALDQLLSYKIPYRTANSLVKYYGDNDVKDISLADLIRAAKTIANREKEYVDQDGDEAPEPQEEFELLEEATVMPGINREKPPRPPVQKPLEPQSGHDEEVIEPEVGNLKAWAEKVANTGLPGVFKQILRLDYDLNSGGWDSKRQKLELKKRKNATPEEQLEMVGKTCDIQAYAMMVGAVGVNEIEKLKKKYMELYRQRMKDPMGKWQPTHTDKGSAFLYLRGEAEQLKEKWVEWSSRKDNGVMKVKFDHLDAGPHTFVVERKNKNVALYQAYEGKYSLKEYMENIEKGKKVKLTKGGILMKPEVVYKEVISLLYNGLGTLEMVNNFKKNPNNVPKITDKMYEAAFGSSVERKDWFHNHYGEAISSVALLVFDNLVVGDGVEEEKVDLEQITYYEEIQAIDNYLNLVVSPKNPHTKLTSEQAAKESGISSYKDIIKLNKPKLKLPFLPKD